jgi:hypothetical protein
MTTKVHPTIVLQKPPSEHDILADRIGPVYRFDAFGFIHAEFTLSHQGSLIHSLQTFDRGNPEKATPFPKTGPEGRAAVSDQHGTCDHTDVFMRAGHPRNKMLMDRWSRVSASNLIINVVICANPTSYMI